MRQLVLFIILALITFSCKASQTPIEVRGPDAYRLLQNELTSFVEKKDARIGIAVIINGKDTVSVNGSKDFPMMSVFKFPLALAVAKWVDANGMSLNDSIAFGPEALIKDTYSPMLKKHGMELNKMSFKELLEWALIESDNNAADILLKQVGGAARATTLLKDVAGELDITIGASEQDMHRDPYTSYLNRSTPLAMAMLFDRFDTEIKNRSKSFSDIAVMLEQCRTGAGRLSAPLSETNAVIAHKTGTGFQTSEGIISSVNDCGYVHLPNGTRYTITVFIADSGYSMAETEKMIADISAIVFKSLMMQNSVIGEYADRNDGSTLEISKSDNGRMKIEIGLTRLTMIDDGVGVLSDKGLTFSATDAAGNPIYGLITIEGNTAKLTFTESTWEYLPAGATFTFNRK